MPGANRIVVGTQMALVVGAIVMATSAAAASLQRSASIEPRLIARLHIKDGSNSIVWFHRPAAMLAAADYGSIRLWNPFRRSRRTLKIGATADVWGIALAPDQRLIASCDSSGRRRLWDVRSGQAIRELKPRANGDCLAVAWAPDGRHLASAGADGAVRVWSRSGTARGTARYPGYVVAVAWSPDGTLLAAGGAGGEIRVYRFPGLRMVGSFNTGAASGGDTNGLAWSPDGRTLASANQDGAIRLWSRNDWTRVGELRRGQPGFARPVAWNPNGTALAAGYQNGSTLIWDPRDKRLTHAIKSTSSGGIWGLGWDVRGRFLATGGASEDLIRVYALTRH